MSILKKKDPRYEVVSIRLTEDRLALLERFRSAITGRLGRDVTMAEAAFIALEDRAGVMEETATRAELLKEPTRSLDQIRKQWTSEHTLSAAQWEVLAEYVLIGAEEDRQGLPSRQPAVPSRLSYLAMLDAFEAVYLQRRKPASRHAWAYFSNLRGHEDDIELSDSDANARHQAIVELIAQRRVGLQAADAWEDPGNVARCLLLAIRDEGVASAALDRIWAPHWLALWGLAARGHWVRHEHRPVRMTSDGDEDPWRRIVVPPQMTHGDVNVSFASEGREFVTRVTFGGTRRFGVTVGRYTELTEFRALLDGADDRPWHGRYFTVTFSQDPDPIHTLWLRDPYVHVDFSAREWAELRELVRDACQHPQLQGWLQAMQQEYGEQG